MSANADYHTTLCGICKGENGEILKNSQILIFDEATANIDEKRRGRFYQLLHALSREKIIIFSTHNLEELREADIIVDLEKLHIRQVSEK